MTWLTALAAALLVDAPILAAAVSAWWAGTALLNLGPHASVVFAILIAMPAALAIVMATRLAIETRNDA